MYSFEDILNLKRKIYQTAWDTFIYLLDHKIDPTPENYKKYFEKFFKEEKGVENPVRSILDKTKKTVGETVNVLDETVLHLKRLNDNQNLNNFIDKLIEKLKQRKISLEELHREVEKFEENFEIFSKSKYIDHLTSVWNRLMLSEFLPLLPKLSMERNIVVAFLDLNKFKHINDTYGHLIGDKVLKFFADYLKSNLKRKDLITRFGGDEFVVILFDTDLENAKRLFKKLRKNIPEKKFDKHKIKIDFCVGLTVPFGNDKPEDIIHRADIAMYECKKSGKIGIKLK
jgi:diguanylate cyclase (GGDEF)-like protein